MSADDDMPSAAQVQAAESGQATHPREPHSGGTAGRLNWLRAAVLGANDGIVSVAGIVIGVAGATTNRGPIFTAGLAGLVAGAVSMALGEYVSVSSQRDSERAQIKQEKRELAASPEAELTELTALYEAKGLSPATARTVAVELSARGALAAHLDAELHIDPADIPMQNKTRRTSLSGRRAEGTACFSDDQREIMRISSLWSAIMGSAVLARGGTPAHSGSPGRSQQ